MMNRISRISATNRNKMYGRSQEQEVLYGMDKKYIESRRYYKEVGKTPEEVREERKRMSRRGNNAFREVLREKQKRT